MNDLSALLEALDAKRRAVEGQYPLDDFQNDGEDVEYECPVCEGQGQLTGEFAYTKKAAGIHVFGIGKDLEAMEAYVDALPPEVVGALIDCVRLLQLGISEDTGEGFDTLAADALAQLAARLGGKA